MSRAQDPKRKRPDSAQTPEAVLLKLIKGKTDTGIWLKDLKRDANLPDTVVTKAMKSLLAQKAIKEVVNIQSKGKKHYMAAEFEPSKELTGGTWYVDGNLDVEFITSLKLSCSKIIRKLNVATMEGICDFFKKNRITTDECSTSQISQIIKSMVLDNDVIEMRSTGLGDCVSIPIGTVCYRLSTGMGLGKGPRVGAMASIPCGVCPKINQCTPDGIISPATCVYYTKWLDFEF